MKEKPSGNKEKISENNKKVFYLERDFYSNPQVVIVTASNKQEATEILNAQLEKDNYQPGEFGELKELDTSQKGLRIISPLGDRHFTH